MNINRKIRQLQYRYIIKKSFLIFNNEAAQIPTVKLYFGAQTGNFINTQSLPIMCKNNKEIDFKVGKENQIKTSNTTMLVLAINCNRSGKVHMPYF